MKMKKHAIIIVGAPGSGKGTQGELLAKKLKYKRYVMSDMIRKEMKRNPHSKFTQAINNGIYLSNDDIFEIFSREFKKDKKVIIDGVPRTMHQGYWLYGFLTEHDYDITVLYIKVDETKLLKRILNRGRKDDNKKVFAHRLKVFDALIKSVLNVYRKEIIKVNGDQDVDRVHREILKKLKVK